MGTLIPLWGLKRYGDRVAACQGANVGFLRHLLRDYIFWVCSGLHGLLQNHPAENAFDPRKWTFS